MEEFWSLHFSSLSKGLALLVAGAFPPGPDRGHLRSLCRSTRDLANDTVTFARVAGWPEAAQMGTTFPRLEVLEVMQSHSSGGPAASNFLQLSAAQLTKLTSLQVLSGSVSLKELLLMCSCLPQLQCLVLPRVELVGFDSLGSDAARALQGFATLQKLTALRFEVRGAGAEDMALLQQLPRLRWLAVSGSRLAEGALAGLNALPGLASFGLQRVDRVQRAQLQPVLPLLLRVTRLLAEHVPLDRAGCSFLVQLTQLRHLDVSPFTAHDDQGAPLLAGGQAEDRFAGVHMLSRLQHLTELRVHGWFMRGGEGLRLLQIPGLQVLSLAGLAGAVSPEPLQGCGVTCLVVSSLWSPSPSPGDEWVDTPSVVLPRVAWLQCPMKALCDFGLLPRYSSLVSLWIDSCSAAAAAGGLATLSGLPLLRRLHLDDVEGLSDDTLVAGLQGCSRLTELLLEYVPGVTDQGLQRLVATLPSLRFLAVGERILSVTGEGRWQACNAVAQRAGAPFAWQPSHKDLFRYVSEM